MAAPIHYITACHTPPAAAITMITDLAGPYTSCSYAEVNFTFNGSLSFCSSTSPVAKVPNLLA